MARIELNIDIAAPSELVWEHLADLGSHSEWMTDAGAIHFLTSQTRGAGTEMRVPTRVGPLRTNDRMIVTEWEDGRSIAVRHTGLVSGEGRFAIEPAGRGTVLLWTEDLRFPWWLGGGLTAAAARPVLARIWRKNLKRFQERVESG